MRELRQRLRADADLCAGYSRRPRQGANWTDRRRRRGRWNVAGHRPAEGPTSIATSWATGMIPALDRRDGGKRSLRRTRAMTEPIDQQRDHPFRAAGSALWADSARLPQRREVRRRGRGPDPGLKRRRFEHHPRAGRSRWSKEAELSKAGSLGMQSLVSRAGGDEGGVSASTPASASNGSGLGGRVEPGRRSVTSRRRRRRSSCGAGESGDKPCRRRRRPSGDRAAGASTLDVANIALGR